MDYISDKFKENFSEHFTGKVYSDNVNGRIFYQYQPLKNTYIQTIMDQSVYVSDPSSFNDPFDCWGLLTNDIDNYSQEEVIQSEIKLRKGVRELGVVCLTSSWDNQLMWSHYAGSHTGICLGFKFSDSTWKGRDYFLLRPVQYSAITPIPMSEAWDDEKNGLPSETTAISFFRTKNPDWHYEREWRIICKPEYRGKKLKLSHLGIELNEIIFGKDVSIEKREEVISSLTDKGINVEYLEIIFDRKLMGLTKVHLS